MLDGYTTAAASRPTLILHRMRNTFVRQAPGVPRSPGVLSSRSLLGRLAARWPLRPSTARSRISATWPRRSIATSNKYGAEHVLLVVDIDNTMLAMNRPLGSDQWFEWQDYLLKNEPDSPYLVADTFDGLLEVQGLLYNLGPDAPAAARPAGDHQQIQQPRHRDDRAHVARRRVSRGDRARVEAQRLRLRPHRHCRSATSAATSTSPYDLENLKESGLTVDGSRGVRTQGAAAGELSATASS